MVFRARLESSLLYPSPGVFRMENHHGPVHSIDCSPFHRQDVVFVDHPGRSEALAFVCVCEASCKTRWFSRNSRLGGRALYHHLLHVLSGCPSLIEIDLRRVFYTPRQARCSCCLGCTGVSSTRPSTHSCHRCVVLAAARR